MHITLSKLGRAAQQLPPQAWLFASAIFHYLGPACAVLLFPAFGVLGVAWLRIASAAALFAAWRNPMPGFLVQDRRGRWLTVALGVCLGLMNCSFYLALERLPLSLFAAIEFAGTILWHWLACAAGATWARWRWRCRGWGY